MLKPPEVYQLKIALKQISPPIWRRLLIRSAASFWELHIAIQDSFGWTDSHLHQFFIGPEAWGRMVPRVKISLPDDDLFNDEAEPYDESTTPLSQFLTLAQPQVMYVYDFGDDWQHRIMLERVMPFDPAISYPCVMKGKRAGPWEDSGGPWGYEENLDILKDPSHKEYRELLE